MDGRLGREMLDILQVNLDIWWVAGWVRIACRMLCSWLGDIVFLGLVSSVLLIQHTCNIGSLPPLTP